MLKNISGQKVGAQLVSATDGSAFTGSVTVAVTLDAGTQATGSVGSGACTHEGNGYHTYAPAQAETNGDLVAFTFTGTGAVPQTVQVYTRGGLSTQEKADVNTEADTAASDYGALKPTTAGRTLDVTATGEAGIDWANIGSPTTTVGLSGTTVKTASDVETDTQDIQARLPAALTANGNIKADTLRVGGTLQTAGDLSAQINTVDDFVDTEVAAILAAVDTEVGSIKTQTDQLAFTVANKVDANVAAVNGATTGVDKLAAHLPAVLKLVVGSGSTTTTVKFSTVDGSAASATDDFYNGRVIVFTSGALAGQATSITDYTGSTTTATVPAVTSSPANAVTAVIV